MDPLQNAPPPWPELGIRHPDGLLGATFGDIAMSTPNADVMYRPLLNHPASIVLHDDLHFGLHDPIAHPQPYHRSSQHLLAMRAPTMDGVDHLLFRPLSKSDWIPSPYVDAFTGLGTLEENITVMLIEHGRELFRRIQAIADDAVGSSGPTKVEYVDNDKVKRDIWYLKLNHRLLRRSASFDECHLRWVNVQRLHLNLLAYVDYMTIFLPRFRNPPLKPLPVDSTRAGCITTSLSVAMECYHVGLPVWYIFKATAVRKFMYKQYLNDSQVQALLKDTRIPARSIQMGARGGDDGLFSVTPGSGAEVLWTGKADNPARYSIMSRVLRREYTPNQEVATSSVSPPLSTAQPSTSLPLPTARSSSRARSSTVHRSSHRGQTSSSSSSRTPVNSSSRKRQHSPSERQDRPPKKTRLINPNRDRWEDVQSPIMPAAIDWWIGILAEEKTTLGVSDQDEPTFPGVSKQHAYYAAPDGFQFALMELESTQAGSLLNYTRLRPLIHYRLDSVTNPKTSIKSLHSQMWRTLLGLGILGNQKTDSRAAKKRLVAVNTLKDTMAVAELEVSIDITNLRTVPAQWRGVALVDNGTLPPPPVCREILWEMYELNFRSELILLDTFVFDWVWDEQRNAEDRLSIPERRLEVLNLIPHFNGNVVVDRDEFASSGFAAHSATERKVALCGLVDVMRSWGGDATLPDGLDKQAALLKTLATVFAEEIEEFAVSVGRHYIRTFYKVFARAPTLPRRLQAQT